MNETIKTQLNHRTIRAFKDQPLTKEEVDLLVEVAQRTASSMYLQAYSIISVTDPELKKALAAVSGQPYVATSGHLFVFVVDQRRNTEIAKALGQEVSVQGSADRFVSGLTDAVIAAQNVVVAAESLGMGAVYLGSFFKLTKIYVSCDWACCGLAGSRASIKTTPSKRSNSYGKWIQRP